MDKIKSNLKSFKSIMVNTIEVFGNYKNDKYSKNIVKNQDLIEQNWTREQEKRKKKLFNGNILNLAVVEEGENKLILRCHSIEYKHYLAQRAGIAMGLTPLAVSGIVFYQERNSKVFFVGKRSESVTQYPGYFEFIPSGSIDANSKTSNQPIDYFNQLVVELKEELGVSVDNIKKYNTFCLIFDEVDCVYDIGIELEISNPKIRIDNAEYSTAQRLSLNTISEYIKNKNVVNTSVKLFKAWNTIHR